MDLVFCHSKLMMTEKDTNNKNDLKTYENIRKNAAGQGYDCATRYLLDYPYLKNYSKLISIDLGKQQKLQANPKTIQKIIFTGNLDITKNATMLFITEEAKKTFKVL